MRRTAYLIERHKSSPAEWWCEEGYWTTDAWEAEHFNSAQAAEYKIKETDFQDPVVVTKHIFDSTQEAANSEVR